MKIKFDKHASFSKSEILSVDENKDYEINELFNLLASIKAVIHRYDDKTQVITIAHVYDW